MTSWADSRLCGFDLETTGVNVESDRIVTACVTLVGGGPSSETRTWLVNPGIEIPAEASAVHGITTEHARTEGQSPVEAVDGITRLLAAAARNERPIIAMNASFDLTVLDREARRHGVTPLADQLGDSELRVIDPRVLDKRMDTYRRGSRTLEALCRHYQVPMGAAHTADGDAIAACRVAWRIARVYPAIGQAQLDDLHQQQITWARDQAQSLAAHFRRTPGKEHQADTVRTEWPLIPAQRTQ